MRILPRLPAQEGHEPQPHDFNEEVGLLDIFQPSGGIFIETLNQAPEVLILRCVLKPTPLTQLGAQGQLTLEGDKLNATPLYEKSFLLSGDWESTRYGSVSLTYAGMGQFIRDGNKIDFEGYELPIGELKIGSTIYTKFFRFAERNVQERQTTFPSGQVLTSPPGLLNTRILRGYGGAYHPDLPLDEIRQVYYSLHSLKDETRVRLYSLIPAGFTIYPTPTTEERLSLAGALTEGYGKVNLGVGGESLRYQSYFAEKVADAPHHVNVYFKK